MKLFKLTALSTLLIITLSGCSLNSESPEQLIKEKPVYSEESLNLFRQIEKLLPSLNSSLLLPRNSSEVAKINEVDLDKDGEKELVVFEKKEDVNENKTEVGFMILNKDNNGKYQEGGNILEVGETIEYANFYDLDKDNHLEIILLIKKQDKTNMYIYKFRDNELNKVATLNPYWINESYNLTDMKIKVDYIDNDDILDILVLNYNPKINKVYSSLLNFDGKIKLLDCIEHENVKNLNNLYITYGQVDANKNGIVLDIPNLKENNYRTQILYTKDKKLKKVFEDDDKNLMKPYYIPVEDINKDKVLEIPIVGGSSSIYTLQSSSTVSWYRWNGKNNEDARLVFNSRIYYNYKYNFKLEIPNNLVNKIYSEQEYQGENILFKFYYNDLVENEPKNIFTIVVYPKSSVDEGKSITTKSSVILTESYDNTYILQKNNEELLDKFNITTEALMEYFSLIY
ncbi:hypothetical protein [Romboutsia ilealis]|uniref:hypothetical protein n=1 Tax=Romboutsia ilealis TaxID=1115758 RepID=UPI0025B76CCA|nr:hypothetical protein [Romboutsia ilealis]